MPVYPVTHGEGKTFSLPGEEKSIGVMHERSRDNMRIRKVISIFFLVFICITAVYYYLKHRDDFYLITTLSVGSVLVVASLIIIHQLIYGLQLKILTDHYNLDLNFLQCFGLSRMATFINLWTPVGGGASFKAIYLKKFYNLNYSSYIASMGIVNVIHILVNSLGAMILLLFTGKRIAMFLFLTAGLCSLGTLSFFLAGHKMGKYLIPLIRYFKNIFEAWEDIRRDRVTIMKLITLSFFIFLLSTIGIYFLFRAFSSDLSLPASGTIAAFTAITGVINLIPGNFGIREAVIIMISGIYGIQVNESIHAAALGRILSVIWTFLLAPLFKCNISEKKGKVL